MKKNNRKILALFLTITFIGYSLIDTNTAFVSTAYAHEHIETQNQIVDCDQDSDNCEQKQTEDCDSCVTNNHCHYDLLAIPFLKTAFTEKQNLLFSKNFGKYKNLNYPPKSPPS